MKILYLAHRIPYPPNKGDKIRSFHELKHLSRRHEIHLVAFCDQKEDLHFADSDACKWGQYAVLKKAPPKWLYAYEAQRLKEYEIRMAETFDYCAFVSEREAEHLPKESSSKFLFVQNGIDLGFYHPARIAESSHDIVFTGAMDYFPN